MVPDMYDRDPGEKLEGTGMDDDRLRQNKRKKKDTRSSCYALVMMMRLSPTV